MGGGGCNYFSRRALKSGRYHKAPAMGFSAAERSLHVWVHENSKNSGFSPVNELHIVRWGHLGKKTVASTNHGHRGCQIYLGGTITGHSWTAKVDAGPI